MKVVCDRCKQTAKISHRENVTDLLAHLYCDCPHCGHRFVMDLAFSHTVLPPFRDTTDWLRSALAQLSAEERQALLNGTPTASPSPPLATSPIESQRPLL